MPETFKSTVAYREAETEKSEGKTRECWMSSLNQQKS